MDVTPAEIERALQEQQCDTLIHGHTHRPAIHAMTLDGEPAERIVLAEWHEDAGQCVSVSDSGVAVEPVIP